MRTIDEIKKDINRCHQDQKKATSLISHFTNELAKAQALESEIDAVLPLVEKVRNTLNDVNEDVKEKGRQFVGESGFIKCILGSIESRMHSVASTRYENIEYYYEQLKKMKSDINITEIQGFINRYNGEFSQYQSDLEKYQRELQEVTALGGI